MLRLVINMNGSNDRLESITRQLNAMSVDFERIEAVDGRLLPEEQIRQMQSPINDFKSKARYTRLLNAGEIGCFLSHKKCWKRLLDSEEKWALIMEDDIRISSKAKSYLQSDDWIPADVKICQLSMINYERAKESIIAPEILKIDQTLSLVQPKFPTPVGTQAYIVSRDVVPYLLDSSETMICPVDDFLFSPWFEIAPKFKIWRTSPLLVLESPRFSSNIGDRKKKVQKAPFWIRKSPQRFYLSYKIRKEQKRGNKFSFEFFE